MSWGLALALGDGAQSTVAVMGTPLRSHAPCKVARIPLSCQAVYETRAALASRNAISNIRGNSFPFPTHGIRRVSVSVLVIKMW